MTTVASRKAKGRRLQAEVAVLLARAFDLTIEACKPTKPGIKDGIVWKPEGEGADLRIRNSGQPGTDVALLSEKARVLVRSPYSATHLSIECKNDESWSFGPTCWSDNVLPALADKAFNQAVKQGDGEPFVVLSRNRHPNLALFRCVDYDLAWFDSGGLLFLRRAPYVVTLLDNAINWIKSVQRNT